MGEGGTLAQRRKKLLSLLNSLNMVTAEQVTGADWRQLTYPGRNPLNSLTPLSTHNASDLHLTMLLFPGDSTTTPSLPPFPPLLPGVICKSTRHYLALLHFH